MNGIARSVTAREPPERQYKEWQIIGKLNRIYQYDSLIGYPTGYFRKAIDTALSSLSSERIHIAEV